MAGRGEMKLEGMNELISSLDRVSLEVGGMLKQEALKAGAEKLKDKIEHHPNIPRSNKAKEHAADMFEIEKVDDDYYDVGVKKDGFYLLFHEIGARGGVYKVKGEYYITPDIPAKPFVRPSLIEGSDDIQEAMGRKIKRGLGL